jgi:hypothetical protein
MQKFEAHFQMERESKKTGKKYKQWTFYGYSPLPEDWRERKHELKGEWLHVELYNGKTDRFRLEDGMTIDDIL